LDQGDAANFGHGGFQNRHLLDRDPMGAGHRAVELARQGFPPGVVGFRPCIKAQTIA
jgi:hypothetical protein